MKTSFVLSLFLCMASLVTRGTTSNDSNLNRLETESIRVSTNVVAKLLELNVGDGEGREKSAIADVLKPFDELAGKGVSFRSGLLESELVVHAKRGDSERRDLLLLSLTGLVERAAIVQMEVFRAFATVWIGDPVMGEGVEEARIKRSADGVDEIAALVASFALDERLDAAVRLEATAFLVQLSTEEPVVNDAFVSGARILQDRLSKKRAADDQERRDSPHDIEWTIPVRAKTNRAIRVRSLPRTNSVTRGGRLLPATGLTDATGPKCLGNATNSPVLPPDITEKTDMP